MYMQRTKDKLGWGRGLREIEREKERAIERHQNTQNTQHSIIHSHTLHYILTLSFTHAHPMHANTTSEEETLTSQNEH